MSSNPPLSSRDLNTERIASADLARPPAAIELPAAPDGYGGYRNYDLDKGRGIGSGPGWFPDQGFGDFEAGAYDVPENELCPRHGAGWEAW